MDQRQKDLIKFLGMMVALAESDGVPDTAEVLRQVALEIEQLHGEVVDLRDRRKAYVELMTSSGRVKDDEIERLQAAIKEIEAIACGEEQVVENDTDGMRWIWGEN